MKNLTLRNAKNHTSHTVYQTSNSYGDQLLTLLIEHTNGSKSEYTESFSEGNWTEFNKDNMTEIFKRNLPLTVKNSNGNEFTVSFVNQGDTYGNDNCLTHSESEPLVEFYDSEFDHTELGQFVSRYYLTTILEIGKNHGLCLDSGIPKWNLDENAMNQVKNWLLKIK